MDKDKYGYPLEECKVIITLKDNQILLGKYDPSVGFMTSDGKMIWKENVLSYKIFMDDEDINILKRRVEALKKQNRKLKGQRVFLLQRVDSYDNSIDKQFYTTDEEVAKEWNNFYKRNYYYGQAIELEEFTDKEHIKEELESD